MKIVESLKQNFFNRADHEKIFSYAKKTVVGFAVIILGIYFGNMLFGNSSLEVLLGLKKGKTELEQRVEELKHANAKLQKELFELQQLDPDIRQ
ncbi:MAG: septum formation initiator [Campylobacteraceae bacterium]|jgi:cell division protein FtsB|nr:septum formation initiator [Campylobacteraceae bacterium]